MSITPLEVTDDGALSLTKINDNFAELDERPSEPSGSNSQIQYNNNGAFGGARIEYSQSGNNSFLEHGGSGYLAIQGPSVYIANADFASYLQVGNGFATFSNGASGFWEMSTNNLTFNTAGSGAVIRFETPNGSDYRYKGASDQYGVLDFSLVSTSNKTFTFPNKTGNVTVASTGIGERKVIYKSADETVNNSSTFQNDDHLSFAIGANEAWSFSLMFSYRTGVTPRLKYRIESPSGATTRTYSNYYLDVFHDSSGNYDEVLLAGTAISDTDKGEVATGFVRNGSTAGNVTLQWAQNTAHESDTKVLQGSYLIAERLA
jgi:hypothetical protein